MPLNSLIYIIILGSGRLAIASLQNNGFAKLCETARFRKVPQGFEVRKVRPPQQQFSLVKLSFPKKGLLTKETSERIVSLNRNEILKWNETAGKQSLLQSSAGATLRAA